MRKKLPKIIQEVGFDFSWDNKKVWELDLPVEEINISELNWHFDIPFWDKKNGYYDLTPYEVLNNLDIYKEEYQRIVSSNLKYPLDIMFWKKRWLLLDGLHRLAKAQVLEMKKIKIRKIPQSYIEDIKKQ